MEVPGNDVYKADDEHIDDFKAFCRFLGENLGEEGINTFVMHNEPDHGWSYNQNDYGSRRWRNTPQEYTTQCSTCIEELLEYHPNPNSVYIIFGSFAGHDTSGVVADMTNSMDLNLVDCIDFHVYGDSLPLEPDPPYVTQTAATISAKLDAFCQANRDKDWSILETAGPLIQFPVDSIPPGVTDSTIWQLLKGYVEFIGVSNWDQNEHDEVFIDSLYTLTRLVIPDFLLLPENWDTDLEDYKILEADRRLRVFDSLGAKYVHWFSAWNYRSYNYPIPSSWECTGPDCWPIESPTAGRIAGHLIRQAKIFPLNILDPEIKPIQSNDFSDWIKDYITTYHNNPRYGSSQGDGLLNGSCGFLQLHNYPNTFNSRTRIEYELPEDGYTKLEVYDIMGKRVSVLIDGFKEKGSHLVNWDAESCPSGVYFGVLKQGYNQVTKKMGLVK